MTAIASGLNNPNIIHLNNYGTGTIRNNGRVANNKHYLIFDYCPKGDLFKYINQNGLSERQAKFFFKKILKGVQALHRAGVWHRYLNLENILLDQNFNPKISNFALAKQLIQNDENIKLKDYIGTNNYISP